MKNRFFVATAAAVVACCCASAQDENPVEAESSMEMPAIEANVNYHSMKIERGQVENRDSVFGYEVELEWYGFFGAIESCHDLTGINDRRGKCNELETALGYGHTFGDFTAMAAYSHKRRFLDEPNTQAVEFEFKYETSWFTPYLEWEIDTKEKPGAMYGDFGVMREWELAEGIMMTPQAGIGAGNASRNRLDFDTDRCAFRDIHLGLEFEIELCPHVKLVPGIDLYDYFTAAQRRVYDKVRGFAAVASCSLVVEF